MKHTKELPRNFPPQSQDAKEDGAIQPLSHEQVMHLNVCQVGIGFAGPDARAVCVNREDGKHAILGGALGNMIAVRRGFICPVCEYSLPLHQVASESLEVAARSEAITSPDANCLTIARTRIAEYESYAEHNGYTLAHIMCDSLERYVAYVTKELSKPRWPGPSIAAFPLKLLLNLYNLADQGSAIRKEILSWLEEQRALNHRQHWIEAIVVADNGNLLFDKRRYDLACWRGKQETYFESAVQGFEKLKRGLEFVSHFQSSEDAEAAAIPPANTLFPPRPLAREAQELKSIAPELAVLVGAIQQKGLHQIAQSLQSTLSLASPIESSGRPPAATPSKEGDQKA